MNERLARICTQFNLPAEPPAVEDPAAGGVWACRAASTPPCEGLLAGVTLAAEGIGASPAEALQDYQRKVVLRAALLRPRLDDARARAHAFALATEDTLAAIRAELGGA